MSRLLKTGTNRITQTYDQHVNWSKGVDVVKTPALTDAIVAHTAGTVIKVMTGQVNGKDDPEGFGYGNYVMIVHDDLYVTVYAHLQSVYVKVGQAVSQGQVIGYMGNTGKSFGAHLHFEVRKYKTDPRTCLLHNTGSFDWVDPTPYTDYDLPIAKSYIVSEYLNNHIPNRFKVKIDGVQVGAYTSYTNACNYADNVDGEVIDGETGVVIYPLVYEEDYTKSTIPNRFKVWKNGEQIGAYTKYTGAVAVAGARGGVVLDGSNNLEQIWP